MSDRLRPLDGVRGIAALIIACFLHWIALILKRADAFIGIDSMFAYMANCFNIPSVLIFGKYKYFDRPTMYSGNFGHGKNVEILWAENNGLAAKVKVLDVELALDKVLKGNITK